MKANKKSWKHKDDALSVVLGVVLMVAIAGTVASTAYAYINIDSPNEAAPDIIFVAVDSNKYSLNDHINTLAVASIYPTTVMWKDLKITYDNGDYTTPFDDNDKVEIGDVIICPTTEGVIHIYHKPSNTKIATFTFDSDWEGSSGPTPPIADGDSYSTDEDTILTTAAPGVLGNDIDEYGPNSLTAVLNTDVSYGILVLNLDGSFDYTPDSDWIGVDSFTYHAFDGMENSNIVTVTITVVETSDPCEGGVPRTQGYWKNHQEAWPIDTITIGEISYNKNDAIDILRTPVHDNMTIAMFYQLVAAKLNVANCCNSSCVEATITDADTWMVNHPLFSGVSGSSPVWKEEGEPLKDVLDAYNNGQLCA